MSREIRRETGLGVAALPLLRKLSAPCVSAAVLGLGMWVSGRSGTDAGVFPGVRGKGRWHHPVGSALLRTGMRCHGNGGAKPRENQAALPGYSRWGEQGPPELPSYPRLPAC